MFTFTAKKKILIEQDVKVRQRDLMMIKKKTEAEGVRRPWREGHKVAPQREGKKGGSERHTFKRVAATGGVRVDGDE